MAKNEPNPSKNDKKLQDAAWNLADEWHDRKLAHVSVEDLEAICPGFTAQEYQRAIHEALERAAK